MLLIPFSPNLCFYAYFFINYITRYTELLIRCTQRTIFDPACPLLTHTAEERLQGRTLS